MTVSVDYLLLTSPGETYVCLSFLFIIIILKNARRGSSDFATALLKQCTFMTIEHVGEHSEKRILCLFLFVLIFFFG